MDNQRGYARSLTVVYISAVVLTIAVILLADLPFLNPEQAWITLGVLILAEFVLYSLILHYIAQQSRSNKLMSGFMAYASIAGLYFLAVVIAIVVTLAFGLSTSKYILIHVILLAAAAILSGGVMLFSRNVSEQEREIEEQAGWINQMMLHLREIKQDLESWNHPVKDLLKKGLEDLEEKVRYSDPVTHPGLAAAERELLDLIRQLAGRVRGLAQLPDAAEEAEGIGSQIRETSSKLAKRNQWLLQNKS